MQLIPDKQESKLIVTRCKDGRGTKKQQVVFLRLYAAEYAYHRLAVRAGIQMAECRVLEEGSVASQKREGTP